MPWTGLKTRRLWAESVNEGYRFFGRDVVTYDWDSTNGYFDTTNDGTYHDLDISGTVPMGAKIAYIQASILGIVGDSMYFRRKGDVGTEGLIMSVPAVGIYYPQRFMVEIDTEGKIQYALNVNGAPNAPISSVYISIYGWWK